MFLGVQAEFSAILLDLTMVVTYSLFPSEFFSYVLMGKCFHSSDLSFSIKQVVGVAHALNLLIGVDLSTGVFLAATDAFFFPVFASFLV